MFSLFLSTILAAAPIPKAHEGQIAFILKGTKSELILLSPSGKELKRLELNDLDGRANTLKLAANGEFAIVGTQGNLVLIGKSQYISTNGYQVPLNGKSKPELLVDNMVNTKWVLNQDATHLIATELDQDKMANGNAKDLKTKSWKFDIKIKKRNLFHFHHPICPLISQPTAQLC